MRNARAALSVAVLFFCAGPACRAEVSAVTPTPEVSAVMELRAKSLQVWKDLLDGNKRFVEGKTSTREVVEKRKELSKGQHPKTIVLTCADSRLSPELIFDQNLGDLFVVRTAGNIGDKIVAGSIEYAAEHLHCTLLVVLGHEKCGAVNAAASGEKMPSDNLKQIVKDIEPAVKDARRFGGSKEEVVEKAITNNVSLSAENLLKKSGILEELVHSGKLRVVKAVYKLESGQVVDLDAPKPAKEAAPAQAAPKSAAEPAHAH
jgi:carbonic anhydrase